MFKSEGSLRFVRLRVYIVRLFGLTIAATMQAQSQTAPPIFDPPKQYYLALGDSIAYGFQAFKFNAGLPPSAFNTGYVNVFAARLREINPGITTVNYGCPGESTESFIKGGCVWTETGRQLHDNFSGSQLQGAIAFLRAHPGQVSPITLTLYGNDVPMLLGPCTIDSQIDLACVQRGAPTFVAEFVKRFSGILDQLRWPLPTPRLLSPAPGIRFSTRFRRPLRSTKVLTRRYRKPQPQTEPDSPTRFRAELRTCSGPCSPMRSP